MFRFNLILFTVLALAYLVGIYVFPFAWNSRETLHQVFVITGVVSWTLMAECIIIAARPRWLESFFGEPLDKLMGHHKSLGWAMFAFAMMHFLSPIFTMFLPLEQVSMMEGGHVMDTLWQKIWIISHPVGALLGIFASLYMLSIVWRDMRFGQGKMQWDAWERVHRMWAWIYVVLALHCTRLFKETEMIMPLGWINLIITIIGLWAAIRILRRRIGVDIREEAVVEKVEVNHSLIRLTVKSEMAQKMIAGQFAYLSFSGDKEDPHPFTVAGVDRAKNELFFWIKNVGVWTQSVVHKVAGDKIFVEGPWGTFLPKFEDTTKGQLWVAGGVGIAPFIAWMELAEKAVAEGKKLPPIKLIWSVRTMSEEGGVELVREQAAKLGIAFEIYESGVKKAHLKGEDGITKEFATMAVCANPKMTRSLFKSWKALRDTEEGFHSEIY